MIYFLAAWWISGIVSTIMMQRQPPYRDIKVFDLCWAISIGLLIGIFGFIALLPATFWTTTVMRKNNSE